MTGNESIAAQGQGMTFSDCVITASQTPKFLEQFNRLTGRHLGEQLARSPIEQLVDSATGTNGDAQQSDDVRAFVGFCHEYIWLPLLNEGQTVLAERS